MPVENLELKPRITVIGVGGAGGNAVCNMIRAKLGGVEFFVANTDAQALDGSLVDPAHRIQLGLHVTQGLGAGSKPDVGRASAEESSEEIIKHLRGCNMVFITAGMGGGTGTGAAPIIARAAREEGILTVGVVTKPFHFEGSHRSRTAERGIEELQQYVDTLIIIPNQNLFRIANERTTFADAFKMADDVLYSGVRGVTDLMMMPGLINLDFADVRAVMAEMGKAMMGTGEAEGDRRALDAAEAAISNPLLDDVSMKGAKGVLINITGGYDMTLYEVDEAANRIRDEVDPEANIIFGSTFDEKLNGMIRVSVVATGIGGQPQAVASVVAPPTMARPMTTAIPPRESSVYYGPAPQKSAEPIPFGVTADMMKAGGDPEPRISQDIPREEELAEPESQDVQDFQQPHRENTPLPAVPEGGEGTERRRSASLFERFTGGRAKPQPPAETHKAPEEESEDLDMLEIPAFLRRGG
jgi:cell division protein FtsZ